MNFVKGKHYHEARNWKYQTLETVSIIVDIPVPAPVSSKHGWVSFTPLGDKQSRLTIQRGYCWDGASGPTFDTPSTMFASLVHDALYQLMRELKLNINAHRKTIDELLYTLMIEGGAWRWRAKLWLVGVRWFARSAAKA